MSLLSHHLEKLGLDRLHLARAEEEMRKSQHKTRAELIQAIDLKNDAIRILRVQQAALLTLLEIKS